MKNEQMELFSEKNVVMNVKMRESLKHDAMTLAKKNNLTLSGLVKLLLSREIEKEKRGKV